MSSQVSAATTTTTGDSNRRLTRPSTAPTSRPKMMLDQDILNSSINQSAEDNTRSVSQVNTTLFPKQLQQVKLHLENTQVCVEKEQKSEKSRI